MTGSWSAKCILYNYIGMVWQRVFCTAYCAISNFPEKQTGCKQSGILQNILFLVTNARRRTFNYMQ